MVDERPRGDGDGRARNEDLLGKISALQERIAKLEANNRDLRVILTTQGNATLSFDSGLRLLGASPAACVLFSIAETDVGSSLEALARRIGDPGLAGDTGSAISGGQQKSETTTVLEDGRYLRSLHIQRSSDHGLEGLVVTYAAVEEAGASAEVLDRPQQDVVDSLGRRALAGEPLDRLLSDGVAALARPAGIRCAAVLQAIPGSKGTLLRAAVGWLQDQIGQTIEDEGLAAQAADAMKSAVPVILQGNARHARFAKSPLMLDHGLLSSATVLIGPTIEPWGLLCAYSDETRSFGAKQVRFLEALANILWLAVMQERARDGIEAERRELRALADALPLELAIVSEEVRYLFNNLAYEAWGVPRSQLEGMSLRDLLGEEVYKTAEPHIAEALGGQTPTFELTVQREGQTPRVNLVTYAPRRDAAGHPAGFYEASVDITAQKTMQRAVAESVARYQTIGESIPFGVWICDAGGKLLYASQAFLDMAGLTFEEARDFGWLDRLIAGTAEATLAAWQDCVEKGLNWERENRFLGADNETYVVLAIGRPVRDEEGQVTSWVGLNIDITDRKREEERLQILSAELDHRVKNILTVVNSMVRLTGRRARSLRDYQQSLEARIQAMARAHLTLTEGASRGMPLGQLVEDELEPYRAAEGERVAISGPDVFLAPKAAQSLALAIHELATNATKYGALRQDVGRMDVSWEIVKEPGPGLVLRWEESGLRGLRRPRRQGFGTTVITQVLHAQLEADVAWDFRPTGISCVIRLASDCFLGTGMAPWR